MMPDKKKLCFVVGPIGAEDTDTRIHADWLLEEIIQPVMAEFTDFEVKRADQDHRPGLIDAQLINDLLTAELVIADLSGLNPNAFYEIGIRHMAQKPVIHMQLAAESIPFDVSLYRAIKFSRARPRDLRTAKEVLKAQVQAVLADGYQIENPVTNARGRIKLDEHATSGQKLIMDDLEALAERVEMVEDEIRFLTPKSISPPPDPNIIQSTLFNRREELKGASTIVTFTRKGGLSEEHVKKIMVAVLNKASPVTQLARTPVSVTVLMPGSVRPDEIRDQLKHLSGLEITSP
jgi:hypothetical protein